MRFARQAFLRHRELCFLCKRRKQCLYVRRAREKSPASPDWRAASRIYGAVWYQGNESSFYASARRTWVLFCLWKNIACNFISNVCCSEKKQPDLYSASGEKRKEIFFFLPSSFSSSKHFPKITRQARWNNKQCNCNLSHVHVRKKLRSKDRDLERGMSARTRGKLSPTF